jgi:16S rRNA (uracil1498-N3)-methyltransferase
MNLILFSEDESAHPLPRSDPRAVHLLQTLRRREGDCFDAGFLNGPRTKGMIAKITDEALLLAFDPVSPPPPLHPVSLLVGLPRPQTARKILQEATSLGVEEIHFTPTEKGEPSYAASKLWSTGEYRRHLIAGAEQAFTTRIPLLEHHQDLTAALDQLLAGRVAVALDNYEATGPLRDFQPAGCRCLLVVGAERGWSAEERDLFRARKIPLLQLGSNVLRTETACVGGLAILLAKMQCI